MTSEEAYAILDDLLAKYGEHFDAIQIHASWMDNDGTGSSRCIHRGGGNWYARESMSREFVEQGKALDAAQFIAREMKKDNE